MKKSLLALAVLGAFTGVASAQSSVTLYGTIDLNARYVKNDGTDARYSMGTDGINSSQLGFRGVEDLGGGLKASFVLLSGVNADTGTTNTKFFNRKATIGLSGGFGEVRLGRDYTPTFWNYTVFDAFGTNGVGSSANMVPAVVQQSTFVRADNSIGYFLPAMGGLYGQVMVAAGEGGNMIAANGTQRGSTGNVSCAVRPVTIPATCTTSVPANSGQYMGGRIGFAAGPFDVAGSYGQTGVDSINEDAKSWSIGGSFNFGIAKILGYYAETELTTQKATVYSISSAIPLGAGEIHVSYSNGELDNVNAAADQFAIGYVHNLSKRTALYTTYSMMSNDGIATNSVAGGSSIAAPPTPGGKSQGFEFGVRHFF
jgi:predicted porin